MKNKSIIVLLSVILLSSLFIGSYALARNDVRYNPVKYNPFTQLWQAIFGIKADVKELQSQTSDLQSQEQQTQTTTQNLQAQIIDLQAQINELKNSQTVSGTIRHVYEGSIDTTLNGDFILPEDLNSNPYIIYHYKKIVVPELTLNDMPNVQFFYKSPATDFRSQTWMQYDSVNYDEGAIYVLYKQINFNIYPIIFVTDYKIVVTK